MEMIIEMIFWLLCIIVFYNFNVSLHNDTMYQFKSIDDGMHEPDDEWNQYNQSCNILVFN